jgi:glycosyltransferase involved in cell wall biosynthesis
MMFSIVIPTRARPDTLRHAVRTVLAQSDGDFEVIVHESGDDPAVAAAVAEFNDPRIRFFKTGEPVRMTENWERALAHVRGDYVLFIGDDDGLLADACVIARGILNAKPGHVLSWLPASYFWPRYFDAEMANWASAVCGTELTCTLRNSRSLLAMAYRFRATYSDLPMIYNAFVPRAVIEGVRGLHGRYFVGSAPDVTSGLANLYFTQHYLHCNRPLSINAASHHSTGHAIIRSGNGEIQARAVATAFGDYPFHRTLVPSFHWTLGFANEMLLAKEKFFPSDEPRLDYVRMLEEAARTASEVPGQFDVTLAQCRAIAEKNGLAFDESHLLPPEPLPKPSRRDRREQQAGTVFIELDGSSRGLTNVFDATTALAAQLPPGGTAKFGVDAAPIRHIAADQDNAITLDFSSSGNGPLILGRGWSVIEHWGVWSIGTQAELAFPLEAGFSGALAFHLTGSVFSPPRVMTVCLKSGASILLQRELNVTEPRVEMDLPAVAIESSALTRKLNLVIGISEGKTPMEAGVCPDPRRVGFGLERIVLRMDRRQTSPFAMASRMFRRVVFAVRGLAAG